MRGWLDQGFATPSENTLRIYSADAARALEGSRTTGRAMISRRTKAQIRFLSGVCRVIHRGDRILAEERDESSRLDIPYFGLSFTSQVVRGRAHDRDYEKIRTNRWRRFSISVVPSALVLKLTNSITETEHESFALGSAVGTVLYRLWYGVLSPLPSANE